MRWSTKLAASLLASCGLLLAATWMTGRHSTVVLCQSNTHVPSRVTDDGSTAPVPPGPGIMDSVHVERPGTGDDVTAPHAAGPAVVNQTSLSEPDGQPVEATPSPTRPSACILILCRNTELPSLLTTLRNFEDTFNAKPGHRYTYVFLNDKPFDQNFKGTVTSLVNNVREGYDRKVGLEGWTTGVEGTVAEFGVVPEEHWSYPWWINLTIADAWREDMGRAGVIYGGSLSYRHMCRYYSGFFFRHPLVQKYEWYWRVEPGVTFFCEIDYDPFSFMRESGKKYGFVMTLKEIPETIPSLWPLSLHYAKYKEVNSSLLRFFIDDKSTDYNLCHFWTNFEIARFDLWRDPRYVDFFNYLDRWGGFFYERWGDAPVHSLAVGMFLEKHEVHYFDDIGYLHPPFMHCNPAGGTGRSCKCPTDRDNFDAHGSSCLSAWQGYKPRPLRSS